MDGMHHIYTPNSPSHVDDVKIWFHPLCMTAITIVLVLGVAIALDMVGWHISIVEEFSSGTIVR